MHVSCNSENFSNFQQTKITIKIAKKERKKKPSTQYHRSHIPGQGHPQRDFQTDYRHGDFRV